MENITGQDDRQDIVSDGQQRSNNQENLQATELAEIKKKASDAEAKAESERKARLDAEFRANFGDMKTKYPQAEEYKSEIQQKVSSGYAVEDAIVSTLNAKGKLSVAPTREEVKASAFGGSSDITLNDKSMNDPSFGGDTSKMREELRRLEQNNELGVRF